MIFRTGSVLIVGHCDRSTLNIVYEFLVEILKVEYSNIRILGTNNLPRKVEKRKKVRRKTVVLDSASS